MKHEKLIKKLLAKKVLKHRELVRLAELTGWRRDPNDHGGSSHSQFVRNPEDGKVTIPAHDADIGVTLTREIKHQLGLL